MRLQSYFIIITLMALTALTAQPALAKTEKAEKKHLIIGWVENIHLDAIENTIKAKLDTGAETSSLDAEIVSIEDKETENGKYEHGKVIFTVTTDDGEKKTLKRIIRRWVRIKKKEGGYIRRPVVRLNVCLAGVMITEEVNLSERSHFLYPFLIGRNMLKAGHVVVDSSKTFTANPNCPEQKTGE